MILRFSILLGFLFPIAAYCQNETYTVKKTLFSSDKYDEYAPVYYKNGIVYCSNRNIGLSHYSSSQDKGLFKITYIDSSGNGSSQNARLFSKNLTTITNDGPVTFNGSQDTIFFSRNLDITGKSVSTSGPRNKLGIFSAVFDGKDWKKIRELRFNNEWYNITTPYLSPDGKRLYFASDKPGGFGGSDLYYCEWKEDYWDGPVNLGPVINTLGNEAYPFINPAGELFFASDGHPGLGGKDIFFSRFSDQDWLTPVRLDPPINSAADDFSLITDTLISEGFFSSNRNKSVDIFQFKTNFPQIFYTNIQKENQYCFTFRDSQNIVIDTLYLKYVWDFGDGKKASGAVTKHCYPGPGVYSVKLDIVDRNSGNKFFSKLAYSLELKDYVQPYISSDIASVKGDTVIFDGLKSYNPGYQILSYSWDFGDGTRFEGSSTGHVFKDPGEYSVNLGLSLKDSVGIVHKTGVTKKITVFNNQSEKALFLAKESLKKPPLVDIGNYDNASIKTEYSAENEFKQEAVFNVELLSSKTKVGIGSYLFRNVPKKFIPTERYNQKTGMYSYIIDHQINLMATYIAFKEVTASGFKNAIVKIEILQNPAEKELNNLLKIFGVSTDSYFDKNNRLTSNAYLMLDQVVKLMNKYPETKLEVAVHTDNTGLPENKLNLSLFYSQTITKYLINIGVQSKRLTAKGIGGTIPIAPNYLEKDRALNRRIDFTLY